MRRQFVNFILSFYAVMACGSAASAMSAPKLLSTGGNDVVQHVDITSAAHTLTFRSPGQQPTRANVSNLARTSMIDGDPVVLAPAPRRLVPSAGFAGGRMQFVGEGLFTVNFGSLTVDGPDAACLGLLAAGIGLVGVGSRRRRTIVSP